MTYPDQDLLLSHADVETLIDEHVLRSDPYAFSNKEFAGIQTRIARELGVDRNGVFIVGSGATGLSINPGKIENGALKPFDLSNSDIDLAILSSRHFDEGWRSIREQTLSYLPTREEGIDDALTHQRKRFFDGVILANKLLRYLPFNNQWNTGLIRIQQEIAIALSHDMDVNVWLFRDYWSLRSYTAEGIVECRRKLRAK